MYSAARSIKPSKIRSGVEPKRGIMIRSPVPHEKTTHLVIET